MSDTTTRATGSIGMGGAVFLVFLTLKLTGHIDWSWWWVTAPLWGGLALVLAMLALVFIVSVPIALVRTARRSHWRGGRR